MEKFKIHFLCFFSWFVIHSIVISIDGLWTTKSHADIGVVLGNKVNEDGTLSVRLQKRLDCAVQLFQAKQIKRIIVSGGLGKEGFYEGTKMKEYLLHHKVPNRLIIVDNEGANTLATVENTLKLRNRLHFQSIIVISQYYHVTRTKMLFRKNGFQRVESASPTYFEWRDFYSVFREFFAFYLEILR